MKYDYGALAFQVNGIASRYSMKLDSDHDYLYCFSGGEASVWNKSSLHRVATLIAPYTSEHIANDDSFIFAGESVWKKDDWSHIHSFKNLGHTGFGHDREHLIFRCHDKIRVFEKVSWKEVAELRNIGGFYKSVASDNDFLYINGCVDGVSGEGHVFIFSKDDWSEIGRHRVHRYDIKKLSVDDDHLYYLGWGLGVGIIEKDSLTSKAEYKELSVLKDYHVSNLTMNNRYIYTSSGEFASRNDWQIHVWDKSDFTKVKSLPFDNEIYGLTADNDHLYCALRDEGIIIFDKNFERIAHIPSAADAVASLENDQRYTYTGHTDGQIRIWEPSDIKTIHILKSTGSQDHVASDNKFLYSVSISLPSKICVWSIDGLSEFAQLLGEPEWIRELKFGDYIYGLKDKNTLAFLSKTHPERWYEMNLPWENRLDFSNLKCLYIDGDIVYLGHNWGIIIWNTAFDNTVGDLDTDRREPSFIRTDSDYIYAVVDNNLFVWSRKHRKKLAFLQGQRGSNKWLEVGSKYVYLVVDLAQDAGSIVQVWKKEKWSKITDIRGFANTVIAVKEDGKKLRTIEENGNQKTWHLDTWKCDDPDFRRIHDVSFEWTSGTVQSFSANLVNDRFKKEYAKVLEFNQPLVMRTKDSNVSQVICQDYLKRNQDRFQEHLDNMRRILEG
jgi:hypothetical protein